jgi:hypothetical protein
MQGPLVNPALIALSRRPLVLLRILLKLILALLRAERVRLATILGLMLRVILVDFHSTDWIGVHPCSP